nr:hypothetical protein [Tanacetum cinerariifolium]
MLHICPRVYGQSFIEPPFEEEILALICFLGHGANTQQFGALLPIELTNEEIKNSNAYKEYYAIATGAAPPKPTANVRKTRSSSDTTIAPPSCSADEGTGSIPRVPDVPTDEFEEELSWNSTKDDGDDEGNGEEDLGLDVGREEGHDEEEEEDELNKDVNINQGMGIQETLEVEDSHVTLTPVNPDGQQQMNQFAEAVSAIPGIVQRYMDQRMSEAIQVAVQLQSEKLREETQKLNDEFLKTIDENMQNIIKDQVKEQVKTSYVVASDLSEMELKKILIKKMEGNKSIQRSDEQRNLYKDLVEAYESDKINLDTYEETVTLKRRRDGDNDKDEEPSAGPDRGSKRRREGKEPESASAPTKTATSSADSIQPWISELAKLSDSRSSFNELMDSPLDFSNFLINRLKVDTLTPELLTGPTYELMKGSGKSLAGIEYHLEEVYKATTDQLDWVNPEGQQYPHNHEFGDGKIL